MAKATPSFNAMVAARGGAGVTSAKKTPKAGPMKPAPKGGKY
jgi:hypothetical protein